MMRDVVRHIQNLRKTAGLQVDDRISLAIHSDEPAVIQAVKAFATVIRQETLATTLTAQQQTHSATVTVDGFAVTISLTKV
jgi:isoleucyl-tRNA synthetase